jgi:hypothetical protein
MKSKFKQGATVHSGTHTIMFTGKDHVYHEPMTAYADAKHKERIEIQYRAKGAQRWGSWKALEKRLKPGIWYEFAFRYRG